MKQLQYSNKMKRNTIKNIACTGLLLLSLSGCQTESAYRIRGNFEGAPEGTIVYLERDSAQIINGSFVFEGKTEVPRLSSLRIKGLNKYGMPGFKGTRLWLENVEMEVSCPWNVLPDFYEYSADVKIQGSPLNDTYGNYCKQIAALGSRDSLWKIYQQVYLLSSFEWKGVDVKAGMQVMREILDLADRKRRITEEFIARNPASPISVELLIGLLHGQEYTAAEADRMIQSLDTALKVFPAYAKLNSVYQDFLPTSKGQPYMDVPLLDRNGKEVKLSDYIVPGKYNMLEFWASWCGPCRGEIPHLRHVHEAVGKDFNIISISIDEKDANWQKAMQEEGMTWTQLNTPGGFNAEACEKYGIQGVPYSLVLDGEGRIIAGEVRGAELDVLLTELLGEKAQKL